MRGDVMGLFSNPPWRRKRTPDPETEARPDQGADVDDDMTLYERARHEAQMRLITESAERAMGRGKGSRNPPVQVTQSPFDW